MTGGHQGYSELFMWLNFSKTSNYFHRCYSLETSDSNIGPKNLDHLKSRGFRNTLMNHELFDSRFFYLVQFHSHSRSCTQMVLVDSVIEARKLTPTANHRTQRERDRKRITRCRFRRAVFPRMPRRAARTHSRLQCATQRTKRGYSSTLRKGCLKTFSAAATAALI